MREKKEIFHYLIYCLLFFNSVSFAQNLTFKSYKIPDSTTFIEHNPTNIQIGLGNAIYFRKFSPSDYNWNLTFNFNIKLSQHFFLLLGLDLFDHYSYQEAMMLYIGTTYKLMISHSKLDTYIKFSGAGVIAGSHDSAVLTGCIIISPACEYYFNNKISLSLELRNFAAIGSSYFFTNPKFGVHLNMP